MQSTIRTIGQMYNRVFSWFQYTDGVVSFLIRLVLAPVLIYAGWEKITGDNWFASIAESMPPPFNVLPVEASWFLASWTEFLGGIALLPGSVHALLGICTGCHDVRGSLRCASTQWLGCRGPVQSS